MKTSHVTITRTLGIDMGHCLPDHEGKCHNAHGHRYQIEATVHGQIQTEGASTGMIVDFGQLKSAMAVVEREFDHRFAICSTDKRCAAMLDLFGHDSIVIVDAPPTAEYLATFWAHTIQTALGHLAMMIEPRLVSVVVYETPNCWATWTDE